MALTGDSRSHEVHGTTGRFHKMPIPKLKVPGRLFSMLNGIKPAPLVRKTTREPT